MAREGDMEQLNVTDVTAFVVRVVVDRRGDKPFLSIDYMPAKEVAPGGAYRRDPGLNASWREVQTWAVDDPRVAEAAFRTMADDMVEHFGLAAKIAEAAK